MKPHGLRRILWIGTVLVGAGAAAAGAHHVMKVHPATAKTLSRHPKDIENRWKDIAQGYSKQARDSAVYKPVSPVDVEELKACLLRYQHPRNPVWFPFVGPKVPEIVVVEETKDPVAAQPEGLQTIGTATGFMYPRSMLFKFNGDEFATIAVGDYVRKRGSTDQRFKLVGIEVVFAGEGAARKRVGYEAKYEVYNTAGEREGDVRTQRYDLPRATDVATTAIRRVRPGGAAPVSAGDPAAGGTAAAGAPAGEGTPAADGAAAGDAEPAGETSILVEDRVTKPVEELTPEDLKPRVLVSPHDRKQRAVVFDGNSRAYFKHKSVDQIARSIKTTPERDTQTGRIVGLRLDFAQDTPAQALDVKRGDILVSIDGRPAGSRAAVIEIVKSLSDAKIVTVVIERRGKELTYQVDPRDPKVRRQARYFENLR